MQSTPTINVPPPENFPPRASPRSVSFSQGTLSPAGPYSPRRSSQNDAIGTESTPNPFNFETEQYLVGPAPNSLKSDLGRRRGHKYARSSVSHHIILSPAPRTPLQLPISLPVPTFREFRASMTKEQKTRWIWCLCHLAVAAYVQIRAHESLSQTALSHLLFFDVLGAFLCMAVDVSRNFEVWNRSSISHPFGLERSEVLAGLAMSIILLFMGLDLFSHGLTHALESSEGPGAAHGHRHDPPSGYGLILAPLAAIMCTVISASTLGNHARIGKAIRFPLFESLPSAFRNPSHFLPISLSIFLLVLPLFGVHMSGIVDPILGFTYAIGMVTLGSRLCYGVGRMLLMSYSGPGVRQIVQELTKEPAVSGVDEAKVWQVHYGLCMANFKLRVRSRDQVEMLRERVARLVKNGLGGGYGEGSKGVKWEISTQITIER
ncbi:hypothetical protein BT63DRAFT_67875 [Microthyrium microscopicum]|uniref:Zinc transporter n=1 Tax=Microthyrium microscopicum TaxID=703497 RepID=A0A6A6U1L0_9PEZI|nr:hypothetical protein BT63DRAFT_67875 [Microthyrium microscopicum]